MSFGRWSRAYAALLLPMLLLPRRPPGVSVTPDGSSTPQRAPYSSGHSAVFRVTNTSGSTATYTLTCWGGTANITCTSQSHSVITLLNNEFIDVTAWYSVGAPAGGSGQLRFSAETELAFDTGWWNVPIGKTVDVTPDGGSGATRVENSQNNSELFTVRNASGTQLSFTLTCSGSPNVTCNSLSEPSPLTVAAYDSRAVTAYFSVGAVGTGTLTLTAASADDNDAGYFSIPVVAATYGVSVTPDNGTASARPANSPQSFSEAFTVTNLGNTSNTFSFACAGANGIQCGSLPSTVQLNPYQTAGYQTTVSMPYTVGGVGWGTLTLQANGTNTSDQGAYSVPVVSVSVTPDGGSAPTRGANTSGHSATFTITHSGPVAQTYTITCGSVAPVTCTSPDSTVPLPAGGGSSTVTRFYNVGAAGSGILSLTASATASDGGSYSVPVVSVSVTPDGATTASRPANTNGYSEMFTIQHSGPVAHTYTISCGQTPPVTCTSTDSATVTPPAGGGSRTVRAFYNVGGGGTGTLTLSATGASSDGGLYTVPVVSYGVSVTPDAGEDVARSPNGSNFGATFKVKNTGTATDLFAFTCFSTGPVTCSRDGFGNYLISPTSATLAGGDSTNVIVTYGTGETGTGRVYLGASGTSGDQGWFEVLVASRNVDVIPRNSWTAGAFANTDHQQAFDVTNTSGANATFTLTCEPSTGVTCNWPTRNEFFFADQTIREWVPYHVNSGATGNQFVWLVAEGPGANATGKVNFTVWPNVPYAVSVSPATATGPDRGSFTNGHTASFTVRNVGTSSDTYTLTCEGSPSVTCTPVNLGTQALTTFDTAVVTLTYNTGATGSVYARLRAASGNAQNTGQVDFTVVPSAGYAVAATPDAKSVGVLPNTNASYPFKVRNIGAAQNTYTIVATCSGSAIVGGCTPSTSAVTVPAGAESPVTVTYTSGGTSTTGMITLRATQSNDPGVKDSAWVNVATGTAQAPVANVTAVNPGITVERSLCLTVGLAGGAAECGDLRLAHALPAVRTMGRARVPTLVYSSAQAHPYPLVAAEVTLPAGAANPDSVEAVLKLNGVERRRARWPGSDFSPGRANRIVIGYDALNDVTGAYSYTLEVKNIYPSSSLSASPIPAGEFILVNRSLSEFGAGWWLAGLEQIRLDSMLWVGGDGSARVYRKTKKNIWAAAALHRPDTLKKVGTEYVRFLPAKDEVWFDALGRHVRTVSRLRHDTTRFHRNATTGKLDSITVAPASQGLRYKFVYNGTSGLLDSVIAPPAGSVPRVTKLTKNGTQITAIRDANSDSVSFGYDGGFANRIVSRTDRMGTVASYFFDAAGKVMRDSLDPGFSQPVIVSRLRSHESAGFLGSAAVDTAIGSATLDGPRMEVGDTTRFWADRFGAPRRVRNALGAETSVRRENASFPALLTRLQEPSGRVMRASYDTRGHLTTVTDSGTIVNGQVAVTRYGWNMTWDADTLIVPPERDSTVIGLEAATGHRLWAQDASGSGSRVNFTYLANGLVSTIREPGAAAVTTLNYDARGNLIETISPIGFRDSIFRDNLGRDTLATSPLDSSQATLRQRVRTAYDLRDRVDSLITTAPSMPYSLSGVAPDPTPVPRDSVVVDNDYDREGRLTFTTSQSTAPGGVGVVDEVLDYDRAGRLLAKRLGSGPTSFTYDAAGNAVTQTYRGGSTITAQFDAMNRVVQRIVPRRVYGRTDCTGHPNGPVTGGGGGCLMRAPYFPNILGDSLEIPADTLRFVYDSAGNLIQADNRFAQVRRTYQANGLLATDSLRLRNYLNNAFGHDYLLRYGYDRNGRRAWMKLEGDAATDSLAYAYSAANGALAQITDAGGRRYALTYTPAGRVDSLKVFAAGQGTPGIKESRQYDSDGRMTRRERRTGAGAQLQLDNLSYDPRGKIRRAVTSSAAISQGSLTATTAYAGLGAVIAAQVQKGATWNLEEFRTDGPGNVWYQRARYAEDQNRPSATSSYTGNGLLNARSGAFPEGCPAGTPHLDTLYQAADQAGNVIRSGEYRNSGCDGHTEVRQTATNAYFAADNRQAVVQRVNYVGPHSWEEYWYDALGRRVLTRARHDVPVCGYQSGCSPFVERVVWDGDQLLVEQRSSGLDGVGGGAPDYGTLRYIHMLGMDQPVAVLDNRFSDARVVHYNWRGLAEASSWADGSPADCELGGGSCTTVAWPAGQGVYLRQVFNTPPLTPTWIGSLPANGAGTAGQLYRRNRYYDPASGRFTQEDPIGLAGGLNLYGFANGDPINFSDPFGLCPRITVSGSNVMIDANLDFSGGTPADATRVRTAIERSWGRSMHGYSVTMNLSASGAPSIEVFLVSERPRPGEPGGRGGSAGRGQGGQMLVRTGGDAATTTAIAAHEFGHVMGLTHSDNTRDLMNREYSGRQGRITKAQFDQAIQNCRVDPVQEKQKSADGSSQ